MDLCKFEEPGGGHSYMPLDQEETDKLLMSWQ